MDTRREFIRKAALLAGATGLSGALPAAIQRALAIDPRVGHDLERCGTHGDPHAGKPFFRSLLWRPARGERVSRSPRHHVAGNGNPVWLQTDEHGDTYGPFRLDIKGTNATWMGIPAP